MAPKRDRRKYQYELAHKASPEMLQEVAGNLRFQRLPGIALFYSELVQGVPPIFGHYAANVPALHSVLVFVSIRSLPIGKVPPEERFLFRRVDPPELRVFRCVARYGYTDARTGEDDDEAFEELLVERLKEFARGDQNEAEEREIEAARRGGVVHLIGENEVVAGKDAGVWKRVLIDYGYSFLKKNLRQTEKVFHIPHQRMLKVGMTYEL